MHNGERRGAGPWIDTTQRSIARLKEGIAEYDATVAYLERETANAPKPSESVLKFRDGRFCG